MGAKYSTQVTATGLNFGKTGAWVKVSGNLTSAFGPSANPTYSMQLDRRGGAEGKSVGQGGLFGDQVGAK